jgi:hypothetical protein
VITMVQKVGAAILLAELEWSPKSGVSKEVALGMAAIEAMREPTEAMRGAVETMLEENRMYMDCSDIDVWRAMIDAAMEETK